MTDIHRAIGGALALGLLGATGAAFADDSEQMIAIKASSAGWAMTTKDLPVLVRNPSGRDATIRRLQPVAQRLLSQSSLADSHYPQKIDCSSGVCTTRFGSPAIEGIGRWQDAFDAEEMIAARGRLSIGGSTKTSQGVELIESEDGTLIQRQGVFSLRVLGDGDSFRWVNHLNGYSKYSNAKTSFDPEGAAKLARQILSDLKLVEVGPTEELVFLKARQVRFTGQAADPEDRAVAADVYFGRLIEGVPVVGTKGSSIRIQLIANGDIHSISFDWSPLIASPDGKRQWFAERDKIRANIAAKSTTEATPLACGYFDGGAGTGEVAEELELGCLVSERGAGVPVRYIVPASSDTPPDKRPAVVSPPSLSPQSTHSSSGTSIRSTPQGHSASDGNCTVAAGPGSSAAMPWFVLGGLAAVAFSRRRRFRRRAAVASALTITVLSSAAGAATYNTFMYQQYANNWQHNFANVQWTNYSDWKGEMDDVASCTQCLQPWNLDTVLHANATTYASDLIAVATHGTNSGWPNWDNFWGIFSGGAQQNYAYSWFMEPPAAQAGATEIVLLTACSIMQPDNAKAWGGYRNLFRRGNHVAAGCWGAPGQSTCSMSDSGVNTTWNEIGDELADSLSTAWFAWSEGFSVLWEDDDIIIFGSGYMPSQDCDNYASGVGWGNRNNYADHQWGHNAPLWSTHELCGYYYTDW